MILVLLPIVALAVLAVALGVAGRALRWVAAAAGGLAVSGLAAVAVTGVLGVGSGEEDGAAAPLEQADRSPGRSVAPPDRSRTALGPAPVRPVDATLVAADPDTPFPSGPDAVGGLADGDTLFVEAGLTGDAVVRQCPAGVATPHRCGPGLAVPEPLGGRARFLVAVDEHLRTGGGVVDCAGEVCSLVLFGVDDDEIVATLPLTFGAAAATATVTVAARGPFDAGDRPEVVLAGFGPGEVVVLTQCTPPGPASAAVCGAPAPEVEVTVGPDGGAVIRFPVHLGPVGASGGECRRARPCAIAVLGSASAAPVAEISLAGSPGAEVPAGRAGLGLALAALLAAAALVLLRADWSPLEGDPFAGIRLTVPEEDLGAGALPPDARPGAGRWGEG